MASNETGPAAQPCDTLGGGSGDYRSPPGAAKWAARLAATTKDTVGAREGAYRRPTRDSECGLPWHLRWAGFIIGGAAMEAIQRPDM